MYTLLPAGRQHDLFAEDPRDGADDDEARTDIGARPVDPSDLAIRASTASQVSLSTHTRQIHVHPDIARCTRDMQVVPFDSPRSTRDAKAKTATVPHSDAPEALAATQLHLSVKRSCAIGARENSWPRALFLPLDFSSRVTRGRPRALIAPGDGDERSAACPFAPESLATSPVRGRDQAGVAGSLAHPPADSRTRGSGGTSSAQCRHPGREPKGTPSR
jgi:hypothetical protein